MAQRERSPDFEFRTDKTKTTTIKPSLKELVGNRVSTPSNSVIMWGLAGVQFYFNKFQLARQKEHVEHGNHRVFWVIGEELEELDMKHGHLLNSTGFVLFCLRNGMCLATWNSAWKWMENGKCSRWGWLITRGRKIGRVEKLIHVIASFCCLQKDLFWKWFWLLNWVDW